MGNLIVSIILCTAILGALVSYESKKSKRKSEERLSSFWEKERKANTIRRKDISGLDYISIPFDSLPFVETDNYDVALCQKELRALEGRKILNLAGISNTDLKMEYGVANLSELTEYDENCTRMFRALANLGFHLSKNGYHKEAVAFLEFGIEAGTDISRNYLVLADEYIRLGQYDKVRELIAKAGKITTPMGPSILQKLTAKLPDQIPPTD